jgi:haloalkane dehalogenase
VAAVAAFNHWLQDTNLPKILFHATPGAIMPAELVEWCKANLTNLETVDIGSGIHYLQEDNPHLIGSRLADWYQRLS